MHPASYPSLHQSCSLAVSCTQKKLSFFFPSYPSQGPPPKNGNFLMIRLRKKNKVQGHQQTNSKYRCFRWNLQLQALEANKIDRRFEKCLLRCLPYFGLIINQVDETIYQKSFLMMLINNSFIFIKLLFQRGVSLIIFLMGKILKLLLVFTRSPWKDIVTLFSSLLFILRSSSTTHSSSLISRKFPRSQTPLIQAIFLSQIVILVSVYSPFSSSGYQQTSRSHLVRFSLF